MGKRTHISWADGTWNPWRGCTKISNGPLGACVGCYAETLVRGRLQEDVWGDRPRKRAGAGTLDAPRLWNKNPVKHLWKGEGDPPADWRPFVFCLSLGDIFDNQVDPAWRAHAFQTMRETPNLTYLLLTKRPGNIPKLFAETLTAAVRDALQKTVPLGRSLWPSNAAIGCTVVTQAEADRDVPVLLAAKAALNPAFAFVSMEPLMEEVDLMRLRVPGGVFDALHGAWRGIDGARRPDLCAHLDWVITGGETDQPPHTARITPDGAFESLRDQCAAAGVPFHFKQHGEHQGGVRVGKRAPGYDLLDGVVHNARPALR